MAGACAALDPVSVLRYTGSMERKEKRGGQDRTAERDARLKAALKSNLARRKAQARARAEDAADASKNKLSPGNED